MFLFSVWCVREKSLSLLLVVVICASSNLKKTQSLLYLQNSCRAGQRKVDMCYTACIRTGGQGLWEGNRGAYYSQDQHCISVLIHKVTDINCHFEACSYHFIAKVSPAARAKFSYVTMYNVNYVTFSISVLPVITQWKKFKIYLFSVFMWCWNILQTVVGCSNRYKPRCLVLSDLFSVSPTRRLLLLGIVIIINLYGNGTKFVSFISIRTVETARSMSVNIIYGASLHAFNAWMQVFHSKFCITRTSTL